MGDTHYLEFLKFLHASRKPDWYLEIGTATGQSLELSSARSIAIDPAFNIRRNIHAGKRELHCFQMTSDAFFAAGAAERLGAKIDLAFLDGMHLFEFLLRDFIGAEKISRPDGMIVLHDCVPMSFVAVEREWDKSRTRQWTGDVWKILPILQQHRPDLTIQIVDCPPSGLVLITGLNPESRVLAENYQAIVADYTGSDPDDETLPEFVASLRLTDARSLVVANVPVAAQKPIRLAIKIPAKRRLMAAHSGEFHFANSLAEAMRKRGHQSRIDCLNVWSKTRRDGDVELLLRGGRPADGQRRNLSLMWVLSHGETVSPEELAGAEHAFVSSVVFAKQLDDGSGQVSPLLQCTDADRFSPGMADPALASEILFVGNAYPDRRDTGIVTSALRSGREPSVWGRLWGHIPSRCWKGTLIANTDLGRHYASAGVVLNDHHISMRDAGFVNNRIFDVLACGTPIISDRVAGLPPELADYVYFADTDEDLGTCLDAALSESAARREDRRQFASYIHEHHSFDARAKVIEAKVLELLDNPKAV